MRRHRIGRLCRRRLRDWRWWRRRTTHDGFCCGLALLMLAPRRLGRRSGLGGCVVGELRLAPRHWRPLTPGPRRGRCCRRWRRVRCRRGLGRGPWLRGCDVDDGRPGLMGRLCHSCRRVVCKRDVVHLSLIFLLVLCHEGLHHGRVRMSIGPMARQWVSDWRVLVSLGGWAGRSNGRVVSLRSCLVLVPIRRLRAVWLRCVALVGIVAILLL